MGTRRLDLTVLPVRNPVSSEATTALAAHGAQKPARRRRRMPSRTPSCLVFAALVSLVVAGPGTATASSLGEGMQAAGMAMFVFLATSGLIGCGVGVWILRRGGPVVKPAWLGLAVVGLGAAILARDVSCTGLTLAAFFAPLTFAFALRRAKDDSWHWFGRVVLSVGALVSTFGLVAGVVGVSESERQYLEAVPPH